jgi:hypothetical protein
MNKKGKVMAELNDEKWLWNLALLCVSAITQITSIPNFKIISDMFGAVRTFEVKLKLFQNQLENANLCHFSSCNLLHKDGSVSVLFPSVPAVEIIDFLAENFKMGFNDIHSHATNIHL